VDSRQHGSGPIRRRDSSGEDGHLGSRVVTGAKSAGQTVRLQWLARRSGVDSAALDAQQQTVLRAYLEHAGRDGADRLRGMSEGKVSEFLTPEVRCSGNCGLNSNLPEVYGGYLGETRSSGAEVLHALDAAQRKKFPKLYQNLDVFPADVQTVDSALRAHRDTLLEFLSSSKAISVRG